MATKRKTRSATPLYRFKWQGLDHSGRKLNGELVSRSQAAVKDELLKHRITVKRIRKKGALSARGRINAKDISTFTRQMATMIRAGIPILQSLEVVADSVRKPSMVRLLQDLANEVSSGSRFSEALQRHPRHFDRLFVNLVNAGEQSGSLDQMLDRLASYKEKVESLKARVKKALWYPATVLLVGIGVTSLLLVKVVPEFESMFAGLGGELPAMTQATLRLSDATQKYWLHLLGLLIGAAYLLRMAMRRSAKVTYRVHTVLLRLPILGDIVHKSAISRFTRTVATTYSAGVPLIEGLSTAAGATDNAVYERAIEQVRQEVATGQPLHFAMRMTNRFPPLAIQMVSIGEEAGALDVMLTRVADYFEEEVDNKVDALTSLMEPLVIVVLGVLVGGVIISMYLPIFEIGTAL